MLTLHRFFLTLFLLSCTLFAVAQEEEELPEVQGTPEAVSMSIQVGKVKYGTDSIPSIIFPKLPKYGKMKFKNEREQIRYTRLVKNVKMLLPLAKLAKYTVIETYEYMQTLPQSERQAYVSKVESGLKKQYGDRIRRMSRSQGRLFIKLIDRECNQTGYDIAQAFIGSFKANVYQGVAWVFGQSLAKKYDPEGEDKMTERIVRQVEAGLL